MPSITLWRANGINWMKTALNLKRTTQRDKRTVVLSSDKIRLEIGVNFGIYMLSSRRNLHSILMQTSNMILSLKNSWKVYCINNLLLHEHSSYLHTLLLCIKLVTQTGCVPLQGLTKHHQCQVNPKGFPLQLFLTQRFFPVRFPWAPMPNPDLQCSNKATSRSTQPQVLLIFPCKTIHQVFIILPIKIFHQQARSRME